MGTGAVFELGCNRETKMGVRASGISNQNTHQMIPDNTHWNRWNTEYTRIRFSAFADARDTIALVIIISFSAFLHLFHLFQTIQKQHTCFQNTICNNNAHDK